MYLRDIDSWLPVALVATAALIIIPACLPKDSGDDSRGGGTGWWDTGWDSYTDYDEYEDDNADAATIQDADLDLTWNMTPDLANMWNATTHDR